MPEMGKKNVENIKMAKFEPPGIIAEYDFMTVLIFKKLRRLYEKLLESFGFVLQLQRACYCVYLRLAGQRKCGEWLIPFLHLPARASPLSLEKRGDLQSFLNFHEHALDMRWQMPSWLWLSHSQQTVVE